jgi:hypothetical protein
MCTNPALKAEPHDCVLTKLKRCNRLPRPLRLPFRHRQNNWLRKPQRGNNLALEQEKWRQQESEVGRREAAAT